MRGKIEHLLCAHKLCLLNVAKRNEPVDDTHVRCLLIPLRIVCRLAYINVNKIETKKAALFAFLVSFIIYSIHVFTHRRAKQKKKVSGFSHFYKVKKIRDYMQKELSASLVRQLTMCCKFIYYYFMFRFQFSSSAHALFYLSSWIALFF